MPPTAILVHVALAHGKSGRVLVGSACLALCVGTGRGATSCAWGGGGGDKPRPVGWAKGSDFLGMAEAKGPAIKVLGGMDREQAKCASQQ